MLEGNPKPGMRRVCFYRSLDNPARIEWEYRHEGIELLKYMICPVTGDTSQLVFRHGLPESVKIEFQAALSVAADRWFVEEGWMVELPEEVVRAVDDWLDDILAEATEWADQNEDWL